MNCPKCGKLMIKLYTNLNTGEKLWKCRDCGYKEVVKKNG